MKKKQSNGNYNPKEKFTCFTCGKEWMDWRSQISTPDTPFCSKQCWYDSQLKSLVNQRFGRLLALSRERRHQTTFYKCQCDCGKVVEVTHTNLSEGTQSCGCLIIDTRGSERKPVKDVVMRALWNVYKRNAKNRNYEWLLSYDQFIKLINNNCHYCGSNPSNVFTWRYKHEVVTLLVNGVDRVNNSIGYTQDNCVSCCRTCNSAKGTLTLEDFKNWSERLYKCLHK